VTHYQNIVLPYVRQTDIPALYNALKTSGLATPTVGLLADIISCPGGDFCALANAKSIPIANAIQARFDDLDYLHDIGELSLNISGCINSCGHHHVGNIGVLGVDKQGEEWYQITLGGTPGPTLEATRIGQVIGPSFSAHEVPDVVSRVIDTYVSLRTDEESFIDTYTRVGLAPFKQAVYAPRATATEASYA
ncbi:MAG TPA: nitrite/sulfite reductase, partial [Burkholderiaceae bacterium]|nr:nitrite/sulfite reductase [Burkholderiaceae bacterium]